MRKQEKKPFWTEGFFFHFFCQMFSEVAFLDSRVIIKPKEYPGSRRGLDILLI